MRFIAAASIFVQTFASLPAMAKNVDVIPLSKTSKWVINYSPDSCQLLGIFGSGAQRVILKFTREQPGDDFSLELIGQPLKSTGTSKLVELTFGLDGTRVDADGVPMTLSDAEKLPLIRFSKLRLDEQEVKNQSGPIPSVTLAREAAVTAIAFKMGFGKRYQLETGSMGPPMAALRTCTDALIRSWGYDPAVLGNLRRPATPTTSITTWVRGDDFPEKAWMKGHNGLVKFRLDVDAAGVPQGCSVLYRTNPDDFADQTCKVIIQRAHFLPALDSKGLPVKSLFINNVRWVSPKDWTFEFSPP